MRRLANVFVVLAASATATVAAAAEPAWRVDGFHQPESALYDAARDRIVVSNIDGHPAEADGAGYLSLLGRDGRVIARRWVEGLDAPKGMALFGDDLLVADLTRLHVLDAASGALKRSVPAPGALFLNDVAVGGGAAWITDFMGQAIWRYADGALTPWLTAEALRHPNGVLYDGDRLLIGAWGAGMRSDFSTAAPGAVLSVGLTDQTIRPLTAALGNLDGLVRLGGALYVSDWIAGTIHRLGDGASSEVFAPGPGVADIGGAGRLLIAPLMAEGAVVAWTVGADG